jgi:small subunit ribosomal protein S14
MTPLFPVLCPPKGGAVLWALPLFLFLMKKNKFIQKDFSLRLGIQKSEDQRLALKTVLNSFFFDSKFRFLALLQLSRFPSSSTKARNRCVLTGRSRGVYNFFKISRLMIKDLASKGLLSGVKKSS